MPRHVIGRILDGKTQYQRYSFKDGQLYFDAALSNATRYEQANAERQLVELQTEHPFRKPGSDEVEHRTQLQGEFFIQEVTE